jgi:hypothetical protein
LPRYSLNAGKNIAPVRNEQRFELPSGLPQKRWQRLLAFRLSAWRVGADVELNQTAEIR